jgi:hypothetical protein
LFLFIFGSIVSMVVPCSVLVNLPIPSSYQDESNDNANTRKQIEPRRNRIQQRGQRRDENPEKHQAGSGEQVPFAGCSQGLLAGCPIHKIVATIAALGFGRINESANRAVHRCSSHDTSDRQQLLHRDQNL